MAMTTPATSKSVNIDSFDGTEFVELHVTVPSIRDVYEPLVEELVNGVQ